MTQDLTPEQIALLDHIAVADDWNEEPYTRESLERSVRTKMWDGMSFKRALGTVLAQAKRPEDPEDPTAIAQKRSLRDSLLKKVSRLREEQLKRYSAGTASVLGDLTK